MIEEMRIHADTVGARGMPATRQVLRDAADRIEALEKELGRLIDCVSDEDSMSIANVLAPESGFSVDTTEGWRMTPEEADKAYDESPSIPISDEEIARMVALATASKHEIAKQRDAWREACRFLYGVLGEGGAKGRPMDSMSKGDYGRIIAMIGKAESLESTLDTTEDNR